MRTNRTKISVARVQLTCAALAVATFASAASAQSKEPWPGLDAYITKAVQAWKIPGLGVAIVRNDSVIYAKGFGTLGPSNRTPVNERTLFEIGSSSKAFTATLVAMMVSDGKMRWDDRLTQYLPEFRMYDAVANEGVTLRDALSHRSGIARGELVWLSSGISRDEVLHRVRFLKPESPFRSKWSYQNMMFLAAGEAAAKAAKSSWDDLIHQRIFTPLGMTTSATSYRGMENANVALPGRMDHDSAVAQVAFNAENIAPAGSILSSPVDMAQWLRFQLNDGMANGKRLLSSAALRETHTPQMLIGGGLGGGRGGADSLPPVTNFNTYGFGWIVEDFRGQLVWQHGGNTPGMTTAVGMMPQKKFGVVILSNMQSAALPDLLRQYIFDRELNAPMRDWSGDAYARFVVQRKRADSVEKAQAVEHPASAQPPLPAASYVGTYTDSLYGDAVVEIKDGHLELVRGEWRAPLQYWNATNFRWSVPGSPAGPMFIKFEVAPDNRVTGLYFGIGGDVTLLTKKAPGGGRGGRGGTP
jgi:CubicO group peptidase (beta-lactamase class C family)